MLKLIYAVTRIAQTGQRNSMWDNAVKEYRTKFYIAKCENADFRVRKTAFTHTEWYKIFCIARVNLILYNEY